MADHPGRKSREMGIPPRKPPHGAPRAQENAMTRFMKMFVLGLALTACRTPEHAKPDAVITTTARPEYVALMQACDAKKDVSGAEYDKCLIAAQTKYIQSLEVAATKPAQVVQRPAAPPTVGGQIFAPLPEIPFIPNGHQLLAFAGPVSAPYGTSIRRTDDSPIGLSGYVCAKRNGMPVPIQGLGQRKILVDMNKNGAAEPIAYACVPTGTRVDFPDTEIGEPVTLVFIQEVPAQTTMIAAKARRPAYCTDFYRNSDANGGWATYYSSQGGWYCGR